MKLLSNPRLPLLALLLAAGSVGAQVTDKKEAPHPKVNPARYDKEISFFRHRLENLRREEQAWREKSAPEKEMAAIRARISETEAKLKEWENYKAHGTLPKTAQGQGHDVPKDKTREAPKDSPAAERLRHIRIAIEHLHSADLHEEAHELSQKAAELERELHRDSGRPVATDQTGADLSHDAGPVENRFVAEMPPPYSTQAPKPLPDWIQPLDAASDPRALFEKRILPIFNSPKASSCTECHLSGLDLKDYIFPDQEKTFAALIKGDLINPAHPDDSKILEFISRRPDQPGLIGDAVRKEEFEAFRAWIHAAVKDPGILALEPAGQPAGPSVSAEVIRHARTDRVLSSFLENVWVEMNRCASCHSPEKNQRLVEKHGEWMSWIEPGDPMGTLQAIVDSDYLDFDRPEKSQLLTKPTLEKEHKGGQKMVKGDRSYLQFLAFAEDYAAIAKGRYAAGAPLPEPDAEIGRPIQARLRITNIPRRYAGLPLQADIYAWTDAGWSTRRAATATWLVNPKDNFWQFALTRLVPRDSVKPGAFKLDPGKYLIKIYIDGEGKLQRDPRTPLGESELVGQVEVDAPWRIAAKDNATIIRFP